MITSPHPLGVEIFVVSKMFVIATSLPLMREVDSPQAKTEGEKQEEKILSPSHSLRCASPLVRGGLYMPPARPVVMITPLALGVGSHF